MSTRAAVYHEPALPDILVASSYLYLLNLAYWVVEKTCHAGLVGNIIIGIIYGTPLSGILQPAWEATFWLLGYIGLILLVFEGKRLDATVWIIIGLMVSHARRFTHRP